MYEACLEPMTFLGANPMTNDPNGVDKYTTINKKIILLCPVPSF